MVSPALLQALLEACPGMKYAPDEPLSRHCSFRIGGPCDLMLFPAAEEELSRICHVLSAHGEKPLIIGNGTNLLITDEPVHRVVIRLGEDYSSCSLGENGVLRAQAGITLARLAAFAAEHGLTGLEFAHGIPGTLGGAVSMNAGAYGGEMKDVVARVTYLNADNEIITTDAPELSYRHSRFSDTDDVILSAELRLQSGESDLIYAKMKELMEKRRASQPLDKPSAGSTFKRPVGGYAAALIDGAGLKGFRVGGAMVSEKHAGFVINAGSASFDDVLQLMEQVSERVFKASGITLEPEVKIIRG